MFFSGAAAFLVALLATGAVRNWFLRLGIVDHPDRERKLHRQPIARAGGTIIAIACALAYAITPGGWRLGLAALLVFATGLIDDIAGLRPWQKLFGQILGALAACWAGVHIPGVNLSVSVPITVLWLLASTNAFNLIDGVDGLAAGLGLFGALTMLIAALVQNNVALALAAAPLAGALLGFLRYNFPPATVFLGDSGSLLVGFLLGCYAVDWAAKATSIAGLAAPVLALAIPLLDTALAVVRRLAGRQHIVTADRGHIHHMLLDRGLSPRKTVWLLYGAACLFAVLSLSTLWAPRAGLAVVLVCTLGWIGLQVFGFRNRPQRSTEIRLHPD